MADAITILEESLDARYDLQSTVGQGAHGKALLANRREDGEKVVVKQIYLSEFDDKAKEEALKEARLLSQFDHVNIIHYYECVLEDGCLNIVMEYASEGDLADVIQKRAAEKKALQEDEIMFWFVQIVLALFHVHSKNILHRDLKSQNIFISEGNMLKLGDFGIARVLNSDTELASTVIGTPYYLAPEICEDRPYNRKSDVWALGCVLYELCTLRKAFDGQSLPALVVKILSGKYPPVPTKYTTPLRNLVDSMLKQNPKDRPSVDAILRMSYVRQHVERYAKHVIALSPLQQVSLGIDISADKAEPGTNRRPRQAVTKPTPSKPKPGRPRSSAATPELPSTPERPSNAEESTTADAPASAAIADSPAPVASTLHVSPGRGPVIASPAPSACTPSAPNGHGAFPARKTPARLVGSTWMNKQHAALQELEAQFQQQGFAGGGQQQQLLPQVDGFPASAVGQNASADAAPSEPTPSGDRGAEASCSEGGAPGPGPGLEAMTGAVGPATGSLAKAKLLVLKQCKSSELEAAKQAVIQERERKKAAAAKRSQEAAAALKLRARERQLEVERHLAEQQAEEDKKAKRAAEVQQQIKSKEEQKKKLHDDIYQHMNAHQQQVKQARPRINRDELAKLGAEFAARHQSQQQPGQGARQMVIVDLSPRHPSAQKAEPAKSSSPTRGEGNTSDGPSNRSPLVGRDRGSKQDAAAGPGPSASKSAARPPSTPPWRAAKAKAKASGGFPDVEIYTPFGSEIGGGSGAPSSRDASPDVVGSKVRVLWDKRGKKDLLEVLSQIQDVLAEEDEEQVQLGAAGPGARHHGGLQLPPEADEGAVEQSRPGTSSAAATGHRVEQLRMSLENDLGHDRFMEAYRYLRQVQLSADDDDSSTQSQLEQLLGSKIHLARQLHKLMTLEDSVFG